MVRIRDLFILSLLLGIYPAHRLYGNKSQYKRIYFQTISMEPEGYYKQGSEFERTVNMKSVDFFSIP